MIASAAAGPACVVVDPRPGQPAAFGQRKILVAENDQFVLMYVASVLADRGAGAVVTMKMCEGETALTAEVDGIAGAAISTSLPSGASWRLARSLRARGIPLIFMVGRSQNAIPDDLRNVAVVSRPFAAYQVADQLQVALESYERP